MASATCSTWKSCRAPEAARKRRLVACTSVCDEAAPPSSGRCRSFQLSSTWFSAGCCTPTASKAMSPPKFRPDIRRFMERLAGDAAARLAKVHSRRAGNVTGGFRGNSGIEELSDPSCAQRWKWRDESCNGQRRSPWARAKGVDPGLNTWPRSGPRRRVVHLPQAHHLLCHDHGIRHGLSDTIPRAQDYPPIGSTKALLGDLSHDKDPFTAIKTGANHLHAQRRPTRCSSRPPARR